MDLLFQKVDLSLQNSGPFICEGGSSEPTEPPWLRACGAISIQQVRRALFRLNNKGVLKCYFSVIW